MKTIRGLVNELVRREGLKKQVEIAQVREIIGHLSDITWEDWDAGIESILFHNGKRRAKKKKK